MRFSLMRTIGFAALIGIVAAAPAAADNATVKSGEKTEITTHMKYDTRCQSNRVNIRITQAPANGTLTSEPKTIVVPPGMERGMKQQSPCVGKTMEGVAVYYQSNPGFVGEDRVRYQRLNPRDPGDPFNKEIEYLITVE
jgi:hypothetical protein